MKKITIGILSAGVALFTLSFSVALADTVNINFEPAAYTIGNLNGQNGWSALGSAGSGCAVYDEGVSGSFGMTGFGAQSLRLSDSATSGCFGDQTFSPSLINEAGEADALNGGMSGGVRQSHFEAQFDLASVLPIVQQPGMHVSVSPDRGDGARMSYLRFEDQVDGIHVFFDDVTDPTHATNADTFNESDIATISRGPHTIKFVMDFVNGPDNDVVQIYIDGVLKKTGTSWEDYYRFDTESNPSLVSNSRTVDSLLFRESGTADPANNGNGFLIDNLTLTSGSPVDVGALCKNDGWKSFINPTYKNQGGCVSFFSSTKLPETAGDITMSTPNQHIVFVATDAGVNSAADTGMVEYWNFEYGGVGGPTLHFKAPVLCSAINQTTKEARFMFRVPAGWPGLSDIYVVSSVKDGQPDTYAHTGTFSLTDAKNLCENGGSFSNYPVTGGDLIVK